MPDEEYATFSWLFSGNATQVNSQHRAAVTTQQLDGGQLFALCKEEFLDHLCCHIQFPL